MKQYKRNKFAVFGNPIEHSLSPPIHLEFAGQHNLDITYDKLLSTEAGFAADVEEFFANGGEGCNVTMPFKEQAFELCDELTESARRAQAVNTLYRSNTGTLCGHNTDGGGLLQDLTQNLRLDLKDANIIIIGAGGATRGILQPLINERPAGLTIINRTVSKAQTLADEFTDIFKITAISADNIPPDLKAVDVLINATSASLRAKLPISDTSLISQNTCCYDLAYSSEPTLFLQWANKAGCKVSHDGRGMLVEQAALAFTTWTTLDVTTHALIKDFENLKQQ